MTDRVPPPVSTSIPIPDWEPPWPYRGSPGYVRVTSTMTRERGCREQTARKARPDLFPAQDAPREPAAPGSFPLGLVRDTVLNLLGSGAGAGSDPDLPTADLLRSAVQQAAADSWQEWSAESLPAVEAGVVGYLEVLESLRASGELPETLVFSDIAYVQDPEADRVEFWAWAVHHISRDGALREVHLLRWRDAASVPLAPAEVALVAQVAGGGFIAEHGKWYQRFVPLRSVASPPDPERVRVRVVGVLDASADVRFDGSPQDARVAFDQRVPSALGALSGGSTFASGACADCSVRYVCAGIPTFPGFLGVAGFSARTRALSPATLWTHGACPRQLYLSRDLGLPRERREASDALRRGVQVHEWLRLAHDRGVPCGEADLPEAAESGLHRELGWTDDEYAVNRPYLRQHVQVCPLAGGEVTDIRAEVHITAWDTDANLVFTTRPDTAYLDRDGAWVLRETKTLSPRGIPRDPSVLLGRYPQVAAAVCLLADGYRPDEQPADHPGRVELELLGPEAAELVTFDAADPLTVLVARTSLAERVDSWLFDTVHPIGERPPCQTCEVARWCGRQPEGALAVAVEGLTVPGVPVDTDWHAAAPDAVLRDLLGTADEEEEFPF